MRAGLFALIVLIAVPVGSQIKPKPVILPVPFHKQKTALWCWAAAGEMVMDYLGEHHPQCKQATPLASCGHDCCTDPNSCVFAGSPRFCAFDFTYKLTLSSQPALSWPVLTREIDAYKPIVFEWKMPPAEQLLILGPPDCYSQQVDERDPTSDRHYMVAVGYGVGGGQNWVFIHDPLAIIRATTYNGFKDGLNGYTHSTDVYDIRKKLPGEECWRQ